MVQLQTVGHYIVRHRDVTAHLKTAQVVVRLGAQVFGAQVRRLRYKPGRCGGLQVVRCTSSSPAKLCTAAAWRDCSCNCKRAFVLPVTPSFKRFRTTQRRALGRLSIHACLWTPAYMRLHSRAAHALRHPWPAMTCPRRPEAEFDRIGSLDLCALHIDEALH